MVMVPSCCASFGFKALRGRKAAWEVVSVVVKVDGDIEVYEVDGVVMRKIAVLFVYVYISLKAIYTFKFPTQSCLLLYIDFLRRRYTLSMSLYLVLACMALSSIAV